MRGRPDEGHRRPRRPKLRTGDMLVGAGSFDALVNPVNTWGRAGRGLARRFRQLYPENYRAYAGICDKNLLVPGRMFTFDTGLTTPRWIVNFPTKGFWKDPSRLADIERGLGALVKAIERRGISSIAVPALGCGLGSQAWEDVYPLIDTVLTREWDVQVVIYRPLEG